MEISFTSLSKSVSQTFSYCNFSTSFLYLKFFPNCQIYIWNYVLIFYMNVSKYVAQKGEFVEIFSALNCQCSLVSKENPIIRILCISRRLAVPINPHNLRCAVFVMQMSLV
jgi:hypothetical protein